jgi:hypothetical protein
MRGRAKVLLAGAAVIAVAAVARQRYRDGQGPGRHVQLRLAGNLIALTSTPPTRFTPNGRIWASATAW